MKVLFVGAWMMMAIAALGRADAACAQAATGAPQAAPTAKEATPAVNLKTDKQKALVEQTERLFDMATDLKAQVDKTNKNILSLAVVRKAEEIEALAKKMKDQSRR